MEIHLWEQGESHTNSFSGRGNTKVEHTPSFKQPAALEGASPPAKLVGAMLSWSQLEMIFPQPSWSGDLSLQIL